jgi:tRNA-binding protein
MRMWAMPSRGAADHLWPSPAPSCIGVGRIIRDTLSTSEDATLSTDPAPTGDAFLEPGSATFEDFLRLDMRVGRVLDAQPLTGAHKPAYRLDIDFGPGGRLQSSAQLTRSYPDPASLVGRLVVAVVNFPPRRVAGFRSEVLVLGALAPDGEVPLLSVDERAELGQRIG